MKRNFFILAALCIFSGVTTANANCVGSGAFYTCYDSGNGNSYTVNRFGGTTMMNGSNARTGTTWNQTTNSFGDNSYTNGQASNGNSWNMTTTPYGSYGTDSRGNSFSNWSFGN